MGSTLSELKKKVRGNDFCFIKYFFKCKLDHSEISKLWMPNLLKIRHSDGFKGRSCCLPILPILGKSYSHGNGLACPR